MPPLRGCILEGSGPLISPEFSSHAQSETPINGAIAAAEGYPFTKPE